MNAKLRRLIALFLVVSVSGMAMPLPAQAKMVSTDSAVSAADRANIASQFDRADVRAQLEALGVSVAQAKARVATLGDAEAAQLARQMDSLPAGGDGIIGALVFVFLVLLITDLLGLTKIFPFTRSVR